MSKGQTIEPGTERPCRGCGMPIVFLRGPDGKVIPLQQVRSVYIETTDLAGERTVERDEFASRVRGAYVSHFETCPEADRFSGRNRGRS